tara:strand:+ start:185 stop:460 length:276 start_codon:yes stop_codon:yes gene_type:complete
MEKKSYKLFMFWIIEEENHIENIFDRNIKCFKNRANNVWEFVQVSKKINFNKNFIIDESKVNCKSKFAKFQQTDYWTVMNDYLPKIKIANL